MERSGAAGVYIVIEGNDGTGKSTQVDMLAAWLRERGREVVVVEEPGSDDEAKTTPVANEYRRVLKDDRFKLDPEVNVLLFSAARRELWFHKIEPALQRGAVVLSSRSYLSTLVYQGHGEGIAQEAIINMTKRFTSERYMNPDFVVVLFADDRVRQQRIVERGTAEAVDSFESRDDAFQQKINDGYQTVAKTHNIPLVLAERSPTDVHQQILQEISKNNIDF
ncbi:dTMP kinase [Candidatus Nanosynbacter featherlites]|uniref:Thymidylate kinase n=1 Tax=Candidatus Nanosynbacter featherlites TaxID=2572088 RepID=A0A4P9A375_9BACT|nr:dTMP kinase [Candidatus Nanosynbacter featherlites]QCT42253.1 dTMP kinase [Candidatus Nanosynbacter featherlites]